MAGKESLPIIPEELPTPEELFHSEIRKIERTVSANRRKPIPRYKIVKRISIVFVFILTVIVLIMTNLDKIGISFFYMQSSSMESSIPKGSFLVVYKADSEKLKEGDIITFINREGISVTHGIVEVIPFYNNEEPAFRTKGTENERRDEEIVLYSSVQGKVLFHIPYVGKAFMRLKETGGSRDIQPHT